MAGDNAREVVGQIVVRGDTRAISDPDAGDGRALPEVKIILGPKAGSTLSMAVEPTYSEGGFASSECRESSASTLSSRVRYMR
jgi:hypothetical protein